MVEHASRRRVIGVLLVRLGGYAAGVFDGDEVIASKVGSRQVHGRSAAGGWSQQRFARRREGQVKVALEAAINNAASVLVPHALQLEAVVTGGDRQALRTVLADARLAALRPLVTERILEVPDPRARVLRDSLEACRAIRVTLSEPD
jgi:peptide subunit release factor 1 (eRF1)